MPLQSRLSKICCNTVTILKNRQILGCNPDLLHCTHVDPHHRNLFYSHIKRTQRRWGIVLFLGKKRSEKGSQRDIAAASLFRFRTIYSYCSGYFYGSGSKANFFQALIEKIFSCNIAVFCAVHFAAFQTGKNGIGKWVHEKRHRVS